jgi:hypothetical protein
MQRTSLGWTFSLFCFACLILLPVSTALAAADPAIADPAVIQILDGRDAGAAPAVRVLDESHDGVLLEFELPAIQDQALPIDGKTYHVLAIEGGDVEGAPGAPMLPTFSRLIQIPDEAGVTVDVTVVETRELQGYRPMPMQPDGALAFTIDAAAYARTGYGDSNPVWVGEPAMARNLRVVPITFSPLRYDPSRESIEVAARIQVRVNYGGIDLRNTPRRQDDRITPSFDKLYRSLVVNYAGPRDDQVVALGAYVIICPNNSSVVAALQPLVEWRTRRGFEVHLATTAETGSTKESIKAWLQTAYDTWPNPPEYIALVGDTGGTITMPYWTESYSGQGGETDHPYVQLAGSDMLADAHIGRISVDSVNTLTLYVNKIVGYESTPYMADTAWYKRGCLMGDASHSGYTCIQIMQWLKERMIDYGYTDIDTVFSSPFISQFTSYLNLGDTAFSYRGYWGMSGIETGHITALTNGWKMPYAVNCTCDTGSFANGTSRTEAWIRAGTPPSTPNGGIASVGTATLGTDTRHNNCMVHGIWRGVFWEDLFRFGESLTRGKYELYINYARMDATEMATFTCWNNLMGDPAGEMWTDIPQAITVTHPTAIALGTNTVTVGVTEGGGACPGAYVCLWKGTETFVGGYTDSNGQVELPVNAATAGSMKLTVTKHDCQPHLDTISVDQQTRFAGYLAHTIDDDNSGTSSGNANGQVNPTEHIELPVQVKNFGTQSLSSVTGTLTCDDPYVTILDADETFGTIAAGATAWGTDDFDIQIAPGAPHGRTIYLGLALTSGADTWNSLIQLTVASAELVYGGQTVYNVGATLDPGESGQLSVRLRNIGTLSAANATGTLVSKSPWVTVTDAVGTFGTIAPGGALDNASDRFGLSAAAACFQGHVAPLQIYVQFSNGMLDTADVLVTIGVADANDPTGPDVYGYYAFDNTDTGYSQYAPTYSWIEIDPAHGGTGTSVGLTDNGDAQDDSQTITLPFSFKYYGETFTRATICSNGWIAMGSTYLTDYRNWNIPGAGGPMYMIAPMWDDLYQSGTNKVYSKYDSANHRYIVQWSRLINNNGSATENFEAILLDPAYYPTSTGDGIIIFQYDAFVNCDGTQHFCTVGIENGLHTDGLMYTFFNYYSTGSATVQSGRAIKFMPIPTTPRGTLTGTVTNSSNGGSPVAGAQIHVVQSGDTFVSGADGSYGGAVGVGIYTITATHPSFVTRTFNNISITEGQTTTLNIAMQDVAGPAITGTTQQGNTIDTTGPYVIQTTITDYSTIATKSLLYNAGGAGWVTVALQSLGNNVFQASIPGQPTNTLTRYYIRATDMPGNVGLDPAEAPVETYAFWTLAPILADDMESGVGGWTHAVVTGGYVDQWHQSTTRNHTSGGGTAWKFGDTAAGNYANLADGALVTEPLTIEGDVTLTFWHWIAAEVSGSYPGYAYDGGIVEMSVNGGAWTQVTPVGGYTYLIRTGSNPGPFAAETPVFSGTADWSQVQFDLTDLSGTVQFRFRFGSDGATGAEGWYIDDLMILGGAPDASDVHDVALRPERLALYANQPNPFGAQTPATTLRFDLPQPAPVRLGVFDVGGRLVRTLVDGSLEAGEHSVTWDGRDARGTLVGSGVYFYTLETNGRQIARRMLVVR